MSKVPFANVAVFAFAAGLLAIPASAQLVTNLTATAQGFYDDFEGSNRPSGSAYTVGSFAGLTLHNFFAFDLSAEPVLKFAEIRKATLELRLPENVFEPAYFSSDIADTGAVFSLYRFSGDLAALKNGRGGAAAFLDLGADAGGPFGARAVSAADNVPGMVISIDLTAYFLSYVNTLSGEFALGGALSNPNDTPLPEDFEYMFGTSNDAEMANLRLEFVAVPEPSTYGLIGAGALGLLAWRRRTSKAARAN